VIAAGGMYVGCLAGVCIMLGFASLSGVANLLSLLILIPIAAKYVYGLAGEEIASATESFVVLLRL
jgi:hypothetical protein